MESIDVKTITYDEFKRKLKSVENKPEVKMIMKNTNSIRHFARSGDDSEIEIFTDVIKEITSGTYKSYTMYIKTSDTIASKFYNLTLEEKEGNTAAFITKYSPTENWLNDKNQPFDGGITTFRVEPGPGGSIKFTQFDEGGGGTSYPPYCDGVVVATTVFTEVLCGCGHTWQDYLMNLCTGCTTGYPSFPSFAQSTLYECISTPGSGYSPAGGSSPGSSQPGEPSNSSLTTIVGVPDMPRVSYLTEPLSLDARQNDYLINNPAIEDQLGSYIDQNTINDVIDPAAMAFAIDLIDYVRTNFTNQNDALDYIISEIIVAQIDDSALDECAKDILNQLKNLQQTDFAKIIKKLNEGIPNDKKRTYSTKIYPVTYMPSNSFGQANWQNQNGYAVPRNYYIKLQNSYLNGSLNIYNPGVKPTKLSIARTLIHEMIHVYFYTLFDDCYFQQICQGLESYPLLWENYLATKDIDVNDSQHNTMANEFIKIIASALQEFQTGIPVPDNVEPEQNYKDLAWDGLQLTTTMNTLYPLGSEDRIRIDNRNHAEDYQQPFYQAPIVGTPCN